MHLFLFIGQSNMAGRAALEAEDLRRIGGNVLLFNADGQWETAQPWLRGGTVNPNDMEGLNRYSNVRKTGSDNSSRQGLNPAFYGASLVKDHVPAGVHLGLIVNARGGTSLAQWSKGFSGSGDLDLYEKTLQRARAAIASGGVLKGIIWHQGESDGGNADYVSQLQRFAADLRADLGISPADAPFIAGEIPKYLSYQAAFNSRLPAFTSAALHTAYITVPADLKSIGDNTHWDSGAQRVVGALYGQKLLKLAYGVEVAIDVDGGQTEPEPDTTPDTETYVLIPLDGSRITASDTNGANTPDKIADGDTAANDKRWMGVLYPDRPAWIQIDLGALTYVHHIDMYFRYQNHASDNSWKPHTYQLQYAATAEGADADFIDVFEETRQSLSGQDYNRETINRPVRWLKILLLDSAKLNGAGPNKWVSINEVKLYGNE